MIWRCQPATFSNFLRLVSGRACAPLVDLFFFCFSNDTVNSLYFSFCSLQIGLAVVVTLILMLMGLSRPVETRVYFFEPVLNCSTVLCW
jgi:hypothetical protein